MQSSSTWRCCSGKAAWGLGFWGFRILGFRSLGFRVQGLGFRGYLGTRVGGVCGWGLGGCLETSMPLD